MKDHAHDDQIAKYGLCLSCAEAGDDATSPEPARQMTLAEAQPDGDTYTPELDRARLGAQAQRVLDLMNDGRWRTLGEISDQTHDPEASISARLRDLRKPAFGGHTIDRRHRGPAEHGQYEYRLVPAHTTPPTTHTEKDTTMQDHGYDPAGRDDHHGDPALPDGPPPDDEPATQAMHITAFRARNIRRIEAVEFTPGDGLVRIGGRNGAGKTSVLDSILLAIGGPAAQRAIEEPLRHGTTGGEIELTLGDSIVVTRTYDANGKTKLKVRNVDGTPIPQQQSFLDSISGALTFDAAKFLRGTPAAQRDALLAIPSVAASLTIDPDALALEREALYGRRTEANRNVDRMRALVSDMVPPKAGLPEYELDPAEIRAEYRDAQAQLRDNDATRSAHHAAVERAEVQEARVADLVRQLADARAALEVAKQEASASAMAVEFLEDPDVAEIEQRMETLERTNREVRAAADFRAYGQELDAAVAEAKGLDDEIKALDLRKDQAMAAVAMPLDGLSFTDDGVTLNGVPLGGASGAEKVRVCAAIAVALDPVCRVLCIPDASLLDSTSWAMLAEMAERENFQVFAEVVDEDGDEGVFMEDGLLRG